MKYRLHIDGDPVVKKNSRSFSFQNGRPMVYKSARLELYEAEAFIQLSEQWGNRATIRKPVSASLWFFKQRRTRCDVDNLACAALDALEKAQVLAGDDQVVELHLYRRYDKARPRTEIEVNTEVMGE